MRSGYPHSTTSAKRYSLGIRDRQPTTNHQPTTNMRSGIRDRQPTTNIIPLVPKGIYAKRYPFRDISITGQLTTNTQRH